jgi:hypothetical protein
MHDAVAGFCSKWFSSGSQMGVNACGDGRAVSERRVNALKLDSSIEHMGGPSMMEWMHRGECVEAAGLEGRSMRTSLIRKRGPVRYSSRSRLSARTPMW